MNTKQKGLRRITAGVGTVALVVAGSVAMSSAAHAAPGPDQPEAPASGTLTINKYAGAPLGNGESLDDRETLDGVEFTVTRVGLSDGDTCSPLDLVDAAQWEGLEGLFDSAPAAPAAPFCLTDISQSGTTLNGQATFNLDVGIYFVQETDPGDNAIVSPVPDFYVGIPTSEGADGDGWNYHVVADPKNQVVDQPTKTIEDQVDLVIGDNVIWTLTVPVPTLNNDETFTDASVTDVLDSRLSYVSSSLTLDGTALTEQEHYEVDENGVTWTFTAAGLALLNAAMGTEISIELVTSVDSVGDGSIPNDDYSSSFNGTTVPGEPTPYTYWGQLSIVKHDDSATPRPLTGAEFQVFDSADPEGTCAAEAPASGAIAVGTSDANGVVQWADVTPTDRLGLWVANSADGELADPFKVYCVYETVVPAGHTAVPFDNAVTITPGENSVFELSVTNAKTEGPALPLTGAVGTLLLSLLGLLIIALGATAIIVSRRRQGVAG